MNVSTNGIVRNLFNIEERAAGDVYLRLKSGTQVGIPPDAKRVIEDRYSVHVSPRSPTYTTFKHTLRIEGAPERVSTALSDAVKARNGFAHIFTHRTSDLAAPVYDLRQDNAISINLGDFSPDHHAMIIGVFVGHPDSVFDAKPETALVNEIVTTHFKFVFLRTWTLIGALPFSWTMTNQTLDPKVVPGASHMMSGVTAEQCVGIFQGTRDLLIRNLLMTYHDLSDDEEFRAKVREQIGLCPTPPMLEL
ncbi:hypothetical protein [Terrarubrum flagellatum]|uniref:hypothetical protein n=1 Tax=Terrirubrum flagellatum TaxID=2895980 RepID=UPI0031450742